MGTRVHLSSRKYSFFTAPIVKTYATHLVSIFVITTNISASINNNKWSTVAF